MVDDVAIDMPGNGEYPKYKELGNKNLSSDFRRLQARLYTIQALRSERSLVMRTK